MEIKIKIETNWAGDYRLEYDGKYITLFGRDKQYPYWFKPDQNAPDEYEKMVLIPVVQEIRNACPEITKVDEEYIYIETGAREKV